MVLKSEYEVFIVIYRIRREKRAEKLRLQMIKKWRFLDLAPTHITS